MNLNIVEVRNMRKRVDRRGRLSTLRFEAFIFRNASHMGIRV
jgi:hypothetical protein